MRTDKGLKDLLTLNLDLIFSYSLFITGRRDWALDLMQDTIVHLLAKKGPVYEERESFRSWIFRVLRNNWINLVAKRATSRETTFSDLVDEESQVFDNRIGGNESDDPILRDRLLAAFAELPPEQQEVCYCVDVEGLSYEETAKRLAIPIGTVMSRLHRGRTALQEHLSSAAAELRIIPFLKKENRHERRSAM